jgi:hypothetical protein
VRRLWKRHASGDDGLSLIETMAALVVFALIMSGLAAGMALFAHTQELTKVRNSATAMAQQITEAARTIPLNQLSVCNGGGPVTYTYQSKSYDVVHGSTPCVPYSSTRTGGNGITFTINQYVLKDGTNWDVTVQDQPIAKRLYVVTVSWTTPSAGSYTTSTMFQGNNTLAAQTPVGLRLNVNDTTGTLVAASNLVWKYNVTNAGGSVASGDTDDGTSGLLSLSPGTYTCSVWPDDDAGQSYDPGTNPGLTITAATETISGSCTVTANSILDWNTTWKEVTDCAASTTTGNLSITVKDQAGTVLNGAKVTLTNAGSSTGTVFGKTVNSGSDGVALFSAGNAPPADLYTYVISLAGYQTSDSLGPVCVAPSVTAFGSGSLQSLSSCVVSGSKGSVVVTVTDEGGNVVSGAKVHLASQDGAKAPGDATTNPSGVATFNNNVTAGTWTYTLSKTGYTNLGAQGPVCVTAPGSNPVSGLLPTTASSGCASTGAKGSLLVSVVDQGGHAINNVKVTPANANGHPGAPKADSTDGTGTVLFNNNAPGDLYTYTVTPPAGYSDPGTQGPVCVIAGKTATSQVVLTGVMTVKVTVTNGDSQPTKSYNVTLTDAGGRAKSNTVTINKNKSATLTFSNMPTDTYTIEVCIPIASSGNCDDINDKNKTYAFTTKGTTYQSPNPETFVDAKGGS